MEFPLDYVCKKDGKSFLYDTKGRKRFTQIYNLKDLENGDLRFFLGLNVPSDDGTKFLQGPMIPITLPLKNDTDKTQEVIYRIMDNIQFQTNHFSYYMIVTYN